MDERASPAAVAALSAWICVKIGIFAVEELDWTMAPWRPQLLCLRALPNALSFLCPKFSCLFLIPPWRSGLCYGVLELDGVWPLQFCKHRRNTRRFPSDQLRISLWTSIFLGWMQASCGDPRMSLGHMDQGDAGVMCSPVQNLPNHLKMCLGHAGGGCLGPEGWLPFWRFLPLQKGRNPICVTSPPPWVPEVHPRNLKHPSDHHAPLLPILKNHSRGQEWLQKGCLLPTEGNISTQVRRNKQRFSPLHPMWAVPWLHSVGVCV